MFKKIFSLTISLVFILSLSGMALADNETKVTQTSADNKVTITQVGSDNTIDLDQVAGSIYDPNAPNDATMNQNGTGNTAIVDQTARLYTGNVLNTRQVGDGHSIYLKQWGDNENNADIQQWDGHRDIANVTQITGYYDVDVVILYQRNGSDNIANIEQRHAKNQRADVIQDGSRNHLLGADINGDIGGLGSKAWQYTPGCYGDNDLFVRQSGNDNSIGLYQNAPDNDADIIQLGDLNSLGVYQDAPNGYNVVDVTQYGDGIVQVSQTSTGGCNDLYISQSFGSEAIVFQLATSGNNIATIIQ